MILGGTSLRGAPGCSVIGMVLGVLLLEVLAGGTVILSRSGEWRRNIVGCVVLVAVHLDLLRPGLR